MSEDRRLKILREENPFISSSVGDPRDNRYQDVVSINQHAFEGLASLIRQKKKNPFLPCAGLVFGEIGSGKTHLIGRVLNLAIAADSFFSLAYIQPIEDTEETYRYLLREIIVNLCQSTDRHSNQNHLGFVLDKALRSSVPGAKSTGDMMIEEWSSGLRAALAKDTKSRLKDMVRLAKTSFQLLTRRPQAQVSVSDALRARFPDIPKLVLHVLIQYFAPEKRTAVLDWLKGVIIDEKEAALLDVPDRIHANPAMLEQEARDILIALGVLMAACNQPLAVCFDRLENYDTEDKIRSLGKMIEFLTDQGKAVLPVVFVRGQQWWENFSHKLNQQIITRLETNSFSLKGCNEEQAVELVRNRLLSVLDKASADLLFPFDASALRSMFRRSLHTPRQVIIAANEKLRAVLYPEQPTPGLVISSNRLKDEFDKLCNRIRNDMDRYPPDHSRLRRALKLYLSHTPPESGVEIQALARPDDKYIDLQCKAVCEKSGAVSMSFIIDNEQNHASVRAALKRGIDIMNAEKAAKAIYIRDDRCLIPAPPQWQSTNEMLEKFKQKGGEVLFLSEEQSSRWYALAILNYAAKEAEITPSARELALFVQDEIHRKNDSGFQQIGKIVNGET